VVRRRELDDKAFIPSRYFELDNAESSKSLAQIYEDDYKNAANGGKIEDARDVKLNKDHEEIDSLWGEICYKLDALSNLNFTPKQVSNQFDMSCPGPELICGALTLTTAQGRHHDAVERRDDFDGERAPHYAIDVDNVGARGNVRAGIQERPRRTIRAGPIAKEANEAKGPKDEDEAATGSRQCRGQVCWQIWRWWQGSGRCQEPKGPSAQGTRQDWQGGKSRPWFNRTTCTFADSLPRAQVTVVGKDSVKKPRGDRQPRESVSQSSTLKL